MGELLAILSLFLFSINVIITKVASERLNLNVGFLISISVNALFAGILFLFRLLMDVHSLEFNWFGFVMYVLAGIFASYLGRTVYFDSIARLGPSKASAFLVSNPLFTVLISSIFLGEMLTRVEFTAVFIVLLGLFLVSYIPQRTAKPVISESPEDQPQQKWRKYFQPGVFLALLGSLYYALGNITRGAAVQDWNEPILGGFLGALTGVLLQLMFNKQVKQLIPQLRSAETKAVGLYVLSGVLTISAQISQIASMRYIPISIATLITMSQSLVVIPLSYFFLKNQEGINARLIVGSLFVFVGICLILLY